MVDLELKTYLVKRTTDLPDSNIICSIMVEGDLKDQIIEALGDYLGKDYCKSCDGMEVTAVFNYRVALKQASFKVEAKSQNPEIRVLPVFLGEERGDVKIVNTILSQKGILIFPHPLEELVQENKSEFFSKLMLAPNNIYFKKEEPRCREDHKYKMNPKCMGGPQCKVPFQCGMDPEPIEHVLVTADVSTIKRIYFDLANAYSNISLQ